jgi:hypothetical protein
MMREEEECEPGCYRHIYFLHVCREKIANGECSRLNEENMNFDED